MAINPKVYVLEKKKVVFPKDSLSGGSWFTVDERANIAVLLNGAEEKHISRRIRSRRKLYDCRVKRS